jgi:hypothetical protein
MALPEGLLSWAWVAATAIAAPALLGLGVLRALGIARGARAGTLWPHGFVAGQFVLAHATAAWLWLGQPVPGVALPVAAALVGAVLLRRGADVAPAVPEPRLPFTVRVAAVLAIAAFAHACVLAAALPVRFGDEAEIWAGKAKVLYGGTDVDLAVALPVVAHADYPTLNPLVQVLSFAASGRVLHVENRLPIQAFGVALLLLLASACARRARPGIAALAVIATGATLHTGAGTAAYADVPLACALLAVVDALLRWRETGERAWWRVACLACGAQLATKNEGAMLALAVAAPLLLQVWCTRRNGVSLAPPSPAASFPPFLPWPRVGRELAWLAVPLTTLALHRVFNARYVLHNDLLRAGPDGTGLLGRLWGNAGERADDVAAAFGAMLVDPAPHRLLPLVALGAAAAALLAQGRRWLASPTAFVAGIALLGTLGYMAVFVSTPADPTWHLATAAARTLEHVVPLCALAACMAIAPRTER